MERFPITCSCGEVYPSQDDLKEVQNGSIYTYHCTECEVSVLGVTIKQGEVLDSQIL
jgi:predicted SprT family Zn-dependent metalloprotease